MVFRRIRTKGGLGLSKAFRRSLDRAYLQKYNTTGALKYAKDLGSPKSRATTIELLPLSSTMTIR